MKYRYNSQKKNRTKIIFRSFIIVFIILVIGFITFSIITIANKNVGNITKNKELKKLYKEYYNDKNYLELISKMDMEIKKSPFSQEYLVYRGYSYFLLGEEEQDVSKKKKFFYLSIFDLRKALAIGVPENNKKDIYFCIGKIYYYLGDSYYYQSIDYLNRSLDSRNQRLDLYYMLGLVYAHVGEYDKSTQIYLEALNYQESEIILLAIANSYLKNNDVDNSKKYLERIISISTNPKIQEKSFLLYGEVLFREKNYKEALKYFNNVIELNENNASAYFYRGEIYYFQNDLVKARSQWRKTIEIDPSHIKALKRIY